MVKVVFELWFELRNVRYATKTSGIQQKTSSIQEITITLTQT